MSRSVMAPLESLVFCGGRGSPSAPVVQYSPLASCDYQPLHRRANDSLSWLTLH